MLTASPFRRPGVWVIIAAIAAYTAGTLSAAPRSTLVAPIAYKVVPIQVASTAAMPLAQAAQQVLEQYGKDGWQLVAVFQADFIFRR